MKKALLHTKVNRWLRSLWYSFRQELLRSTGPGRETWVARSLDQLAARRVLQAIIKKTNDVETVRWLGRQTWQYPLDAWIIQEVIAESKPDIIIETGTFLGGSAHFFACICDLLGHGEIISIDISARGTIQHPRITYLQGSSTDPTIVDSVAERIQRLQSESVLVVLDSDHSARHVRQELDSYAPLIPTGSYIHIQDGCIDELACFRGGPGPMVAVKSFLKDNPQFIRDTALEWRYVMTAHPCGWIKRIAAD